MKKMQAILRFLCGRKGAAVARGAILAFAVVGPTIGGGLLYIGKGLWDDYREQRKTLNSLAGDVRNYITGATERGNAARARLDRVERDVAELDKRSDDHERRIYRIEGRP
jgi:hypothetical protein